MHNNTNCRDSRRWNISQARAAFNFVLEIAEIMQCKRAKRYYISDWGRAIGNKNILASLGGREGGWYLNMMLTSTVRSYL